MADYTDPVQMIRDIRYHVRLTGHRAIPGDDPRRAMLGWICSTCEESWHIGLEGWRELDFRRLYGQNFADRSAFLAYLNGELEGPDSLGPRGSCLLCTDPIEMVQCIRTHVLRERHSVVPSDNPLGLTMGYTCVECNRDLSRIPRVSTWYTHLRFLKSLSTSGKEADLLRGALQGPRLRELLTDYLNDLTELDLGVTLPFVIDRYHRPWVI